MTIHKKSTKNERLSPASLFLVTMTSGTGDAIFTGLSAVDQIKKNNAAAHIDVLCCQRQQDLFLQDPRIERVIVVDKDLEDMLDNVSLSLKGAIPEGALPLKAALQQRQYTAVVPGCPNLPFLIDVFGPVSRFSRKEGNRRIMLPNLLSLWKDYLLDRANLVGISYPMSHVVRKTVNRYFGDKLPKPGKDERIPLYVTAEQTKNAYLLAESIKARTGKEKLLLVGPDTGSDLTRPPVELLAAGIAEVLCRNCNTAVGILSSYHDTSASQRLYDALQSCGEEETVQVLSHQPLLEATALIDQADVFLSGDTSLPHFASAEKILIQNTDGLAARPKNKLNTIVLFSVTNPAWWGHPETTIILGQGRRGQGKGFDKSFYPLKSGEQVFDHISPAMIADAISRRLTA